MFKLSVSGVPPPKVEWYLNGDEVKADGKHKFQVKDNIHQLAIVDANASDAGKYSVEVHNRVGRDLVKATLIVKGKFKFAISIALRGLIFVSLS